MRTRNLSSWYRRDWDIDENTPAFPYGITIILLQEIRDELKKLNNVMQCPNTVRIPQILDTIAKQTAPKRKRKR